MPLIDYTYFVGQINIPNVDKPAVLQSLQSFIDEKENETMCNLLGYDLWNAYKTEIALTTPTQRMVNLRDGIEYSFGNRLYKHRGLKFVENTTKYSLLAYYIYFHYIRNKTTNTGGTGESIATTENTVAISPIEKSVYSYNRFVELSQEVYRFLQANYTLYPEWYYNYWNEVRKTNSLGI
jgi:hypothetical protein